MEHKHTKKGTDMSRSIGREQRVEAERCNAWVAAQSMHVAMIVLLACILVLGIVCAVVIEGGGAHVSSNWDTDPFGVLVSIVQFVLAIAVVVVAVTLFKDAVLGQSPFSTSQMRRLNVMGTILIADAAYDALFLLAGSCASGQEPFKILANMGEQFGAWNTDILLIVAAIVSFYISYLFKYASSLQWFYDETI